MASLAPRPPGPPPSARSNPFARTASASALRAALASTDGVNADPTIPFPRDASGLISGTDKVRRSEPLVASVESGDHAQSSTSFSRSSILPTLASPIKTAATTTTTSPALHRSLNPFATPSTARRDVGGVDAPSTVGVGSASKSRAGWRLLWRGGLEVGDQGYRLEGVTFFAQLNFPSTPNDVPFNPFDVALTPGPSTGGPAAPTAAAAASPLHMRGADTDICLSLESMRGRKYLRLAGVVDLPPDEVLEGDQVSLEEDSTGGGRGRGAQVQMAITPTSTLLITYFSNLLCRDAALSATGRTRKAAVLALGDEAGSANTLLIYGQLSPIAPAPPTLAPQPQSTKTEEPTPHHPLPDHPRTLRLVIGRRRAPPPSDQPKVRPGEPLPRAPLFFPSKAPTRAPPPFPNRAALSKSRSFQRATSVSSIYAPPAKMALTLPTAPARRESSDAAPGASTRGATNVDGAAGTLAQGSVRDGRTPGRRGEKRKRPNEGEGGVGGGDADDAARRRRAGRIVPIRSMVEASTSAHRAASKESRSSASTSILAGSVQTRRADRSGEETMHPDGPLDAEETFHNALPFPDADIDTGLGPIRDIELGSRTEGGHDPQQDAETEAEEDIFGKKRAGSMKARASSSSGVVGGTGPGSGPGAGSGSARRGGDVGDDETADTGGAGSSVGRKRARVPQHVLDNKATIRKQALIALEARGYPREHELFKDVFAVVTKGVYFVFREALSGPTPLRKEVVQHFVGRHLDMYLPSPINDMLLGVTVGADQSQGQGQNQGQGDRAGRRERARDAASSRSGSKTDKARSSGSGTGDGTRSSSARDDEGRSRRHDLLGAREADGGRGVVHGNEGEGGEGDAPGLRVGRYRVEGTEGNGGIEDDGEDDEDEGDRVLFSVKVEQEDGGTWDCAVLDDDLGGVGVEMQPPGPGPARRRTMDSVMEEDEDEADEQGE